MDQLRQVVDSADHGAVQYRLMHLSVSNRSHDNSPTRTLVVLVQA